MTSRALRSRAHAWLAAGAALLAALAAVAGPPSTRSARPVTQDVSALELAAWIRDRKPGLRVLDVRPDSEYEELHVPTARHVARAALDSLHLRAGETLVVYAGDSATSVEAARSSGAAALVLRGGVGAWVRDVLNPVLDENAGAASARVAALSRYFGGVPRAAERTGASSVPVSSDAALVVARIRGRGC